jgi:hypothetical protein
MKTESKLLGCIWLSIKDVWEGVIKDVPDEFIHHRVLLDGWVIPIFCLVGGTRTKGTRIIIFVIFIKNTLINIC